MTITDTWQILSTTSCLIQNKQSEVNQVLIKYTEGPPTTTDNSITITHEEAILLPAPVSGNIYVKKFKDVKSDIGITVIGV